MYVVIVQISVQCGESGIKEEEACKVYDFFDHHGGAFYANSFGEAIWEENIWIDIFGELFAAGCDLCNSDNICGDCIEWFVDDDGSDCGFSFVCAIGAVFIEKRFLKTLRNRV